MDVEEVVVRLFADASNYNRVMYAVENRLTSLAGVVAGIGKIIEIPLRVATLGITSLSAATIGASVYAMKLAADYELVGVALEVMTGNAETGRKLLQDINQLAIETPFRTVGLQTAAKELGAFGIQAKDIIPTLRALGDVASGVSAGNLDEMMGRIILAFGQVKTAGRLMGPEARQFIQAGVPLFDYLGKVMDKPTQSIKGLIEEGKVGFPQVVQAFNLMTQEGGRFFNLMDRQSQTVRGRWSAMIETIELSMTKLATAAFEGLGTKDFLENVRKYFANFTNNPEAIKEWVGYFQQLRENANYVYGTIRGIIQFIRNAGMETERWVSENRNLVEGIAKVLAIVSLVGVAFVGIPVVIGTITTAVMFLLTPMGQVLLLATAISSALAAIGDLKYFGTGFEQLLNILGKNFKSLGSALKDAILAEDWDTVGKIVFRGLEMSMKGFLATLKWELIGVFGSIGARVETEFERVFLIAKEVGRRFTDIFDLKTSGEELQKNSEARMRAINDQIEKAHKAKLDVIEQTKIREIQNAIAPIQAQIDSFRTQAFEAKRNKLTPEIPLMEKILEQNQNLVFGTDAFLQRLLHEGKATFGPNFDPRDAAFNKREDVANFLNNYTERMTSILAKEVFNAVGRQGYEKLVAQGKMPADILYIEHFMDVMKQFLVPGIGTPVIPDPRSKGMRVPLELRSQVLDYAGDLRKEMAKEAEKGIGFGVGMMTNFQKNMQLINEGQFGPLARFNFLDNRNPVWQALGMVSKGMGVLTGEEANFGRFREFSNLRKWVLGQGGDRQPPAAMIGSAEAQDIINRSSMYQTDKMAEIAEILRNGQLIQDEQKRLLEQEVQLLQEYLRRQNQRGGF